MKKTAAQAAVERERKLALPVAPKRLPDAPLPNEAPMSAPLPCWISTSPIITSAAMICSASTKFMSMFILFPTPMGPWQGPRSGGGLADGGEVLRIQRRAADQAAVDIGLVEQRRRVVRLDAAAVEDRDGGSTRAERRQAGAQMRMHGLGFGRARRLAGADRPDRFVG